VSCTFKPAQRQVGLVRPAGFSIITLFSTKRSWRRPSGERVVAVPKRRKSKSAKGMRRSHDFLVAPSLNICPQCKLAVPPHKVCHLVEECGNIQRSKTHNPLAREKA
jgi:large subunit ribosomal protein L32